MRNVKKLVEMMVKDKVWDMRSVKQMAGVRMIVTGVRRHRG